MGLMQYTYQQQEAERKKKAAAAARKAATNPYEAPYQAVTADLIGAYQAPPDENLSEADLLYRSLLESGPDYSGVPQWSQSDIDAAARQYADETADWAALPLKQQVERNKELYDFSAQMGSNFGQALAAVFSGGNTTEEGAQAYAEEKFGSKYAIGAAVQAIGYELMARIGAGFTERHFQLADRISEIYAQRPDMMRERQAFLMQQIKDARSEADLSWSQRVEAYGMLRNALIENEDRRIAKLGSVRDLRAGQRAEWEERQAAKNAPVEAPKIEHIEGYGYVVWNGSDFVKLWDEPAAEEDPAKVLSPSEMNSYLEKAQDNIATAVESGVPFRKAVQEQRQNLIAAAEYWEQLGYPEIGSQLRAVAQKYTFAKVRPEQKEPEIIIDNQATLVRGIDKATGKVVWTVPKPETVKKQSGQLVLDKKTGQYVWAFPNGTTRPANVTGVDPNGQPESQRDLSTIANGALSLAEKIYAGTKNKAAADKKTIETIVSEYGAELRRRGYTERQINEFALLIRNAVVNDVDPDEALRQALAGLARKGG